MKSEHLGVVVVRLQVPRLHDGHRYLLNAVTAIHEDVLVVIGESEARGTMKNPLPFSVREAMVREAYPKVKVVQLRDCSSDEKWSYNLDTRIWDERSGYELGKGAMLYGGRDSFLNHYQGEYPTFELPPVRPMSGTEIREAVCQRDSEEFRAGMIFAAKNRYPTSYQTVDVAILNQSEQILLGRKKGDGDAWRFIGGFVSPKDPTLEYTVMREVREETGLEVGSPRYIGSFQVEDYRYPSDGPDRIMTALFTVKYVFGSPEPSDDIDDCCWFSLHDLPDIVPQHHPLVHLLLGYRAMKGLPDA